MAHRSPLSTKDIAVRLQSLAGWSHEGKRLKRAYGFGDFRAAMAFMVEVAFDAERLNHHPNWTNVYNRVEVELFTHDVAAVTALDFMLAEAMERAYQARRAKA